MNKNALSEQFSLQSLPKKVTPFARNCPSKAFFGYRFLQFSLQSLPKKVTPFARNCPSKAFLSATIWVLWCSFGFVLFGCQRDEIQVYRVPHEVSSLPGATAMADTPSSVQENLHFPTRTGWTSVPAQAPRLATFKAGEAEVSVTKFPGDAGGALANVNRWRGQLELAAIQEADLTKVLKRTQRGQFIYQEINLENKALSRAMRVAFFTFKDETYFIKLTGSISAVSAASAEFSSFLQGVRANGAP